MIDTERLLQELPNKVLAESEQKGLNINCNKTICMAAIKRKHPRRELRKSDAEIKKVKNINIY